MNTVFLQWQSTPRVLATDTAMLTIEEEIGILRLLQVEAMTLCFLFATIEFGNIEVEGTCIERLATLHHQSKASGIGLLPPTDVALSTTLLWTDVWIILVVGIIIIDSDAHAILAVSIVFDRTTTIVVALLHAVRHLHHHAITEQVAHLGTSRCLESLCYLHGSRVGIYQVGNLQLTLHLRHIISSGDGHSVGFLILTHFDVLQVHLRVLPCLELLLQTCAEVIIGRSSPEVRLQGSTLAQHRLAMIGVLGDETCGTIYLEGQVRSRYSHISIRLVHQLQLLLAIALCQH